MSKGTEFNFIADGVYGEEPESLKGATLDYFNTKVRPNIDEQHKKRNHGKE